MRPFPAHHVPRPRLTEKCAGTQVIVVEAAGGYGKSVFGAELVDSSGAVGIVVELEHGGVPPPMFVTRLRDAAHRAGFTDAAAALKSLDDPATALDTLMAALADERCVFVIDDAHHASVETGRLIDRMAIRIEPDQRLVVLARRLPAGAARLRRAEYLQLSASDLALEANETSQICRAGFGLDVTEDEIKALTSATGGWTAAAVLAAARASRQGSNLNFTVPQADDALVAILDEGLEGLAFEDRVLLAQIARLPFVDADLVRTVTGDATLFERALQVGIPFTRASDPWWSLPGPVADYLASFAAPDQEQMRRAADEYRRRGELGAGLDLLHAVGDSSGAAATMAAITPDVEETLDTLELRAHFDQLSPSAIEAHPEVLVLIARRVGYANLYDQACRLLERALDISARSGDEELGRAASAELVKDRLLADMRYPEAVAEVRRILEETGDGERLTNARASEFLGYALCHLADEHGRRPLAALHEAEQCMARASSLYHALGMRSAAAFLEVDRAVHIEFPQGRVHAALARIEDALIMIADRPRARGFVMIWKTLFAAELGQNELCRASGSEAFRFATWMESGFLAALAHWKLAVLESYTGDAAATLEHVRQVENRSRAWWKLLSDEILAESADLLDRVGHQDLALQYLAQAKANPADAGHVVALSEAVIEARHGDPVIAEDKLTSLENGRLDERERWRVTLLRAFAAYRRGANDQAAALSARAFEEAARLGQRQAPHIRERAITEQLLPLAVSTGLPAALDLEAGGLPTSLAVLGRFDLTVGGRTVQLSHGQEARLIKFVVARGGQVHAEEAIDALWPDASTDTGRNRLRTVLHRLRATAGPVINRSGDLLQLAPEIGVDLYQFEAEAARAHNLAVEDPALAAVVARGAIARYRGDLLPEDRYEMWVESPRERARGTLVDLLQLCAREASKRGDLDDLRRIVEQSIEISPFDDTLYVQAATTLVDQGRRGEALSVIERARNALGEIGIEPPPALLQLEASVLGRRILRAI